MLPFWSKGASVRELLNIETELISITASVETDYDDVSIPWKSDVVQGLLCQVRTLV